MIINKNPVSMAEALEYVKDDEKGAEIKGFIKKFTKINLEEAKKIKEKFRVLDLIKVKPEQITKIIDLMPEDAGELNKIFTDVNLNEDETKKILDTIKEFR